MLEKKMWKGKKGDFEIQAKVLHLFLGFSYGSNDLQADMDANSGFTLCAHIQANVNNLISIHLLNAIKRQRY